MNTTSLQRRLVDLSEGVCQIDLREYEEQSLAVLATGLVPRMRRVLDEALDLLDELVTAEESPREPDKEFTDSAFFQKVDTLMAEAPPPSALADLAFMGCFELRAKRDRLTKVVAGIPNVPAWRLPRETYGGLLAPEFLALAGGARRKLLKIVTALEVLLCRETGLEPRLGFQTETAFSLQVRKAYTKLRHAILDDGEPQVDEVPARLRSACTAIARLRGRDAYWHLRYCDRLELRRLQRRILTYMGNASDDKARSGLRLWQDIAGFVRLLEAVNQRSELVEHDRSLVDEVYTELFFTAPPPPRIPPEIVEKMSRLYGLDESLDRLIVAGGDGAPDEWRLPLVRLRNRFQRPEASPAPDDGAPMPRFNAG